MESALTNPVFIVFASATLICTVPALAHYWWKVRRDEIDASLKQTMLEQGRSAEEIRQVLESRTDRPRTTRRCARWAWR